jgi:hypothetical protein
LMMLFDWHPYASLPVASSRFLFGYLIYCVSLIGSNLHWSKTYVAHNSDCSNALFANPKLLWAFSSNRRTSIASFFVICPNRVGNDSSALQLWYFRFVFRRLNDSQQMVNI